jgi:hypothetical protein
VRRRETPHLGLRRARPAGPVTGLGRRTPNEPERLPSARPGSRDPRRLPRSLFTHTTSPPHPVACREPGPPRQRMAGRFKLSRLRSSRPGLPRDAPRGTRKMRLTDFCNRPTTRAPQGLPDSRVRTPPRFATLAGFLHDGSRRPNLGQWPPLSPQVKLRLTANLQLQPCRNPSRSCAFESPRKRGWA